MKRNLGKKVLGVVLAGVMTLSMAVPAGVLQDTVVMAAENETESIVPVMPEGSALHQNRVDEGVVLEDKEDYEQESLGMPSFEVREKQAMVGGFRSKKGLQGANLYEGEYQDLGVTQALYNCNIFDIIGTKEDHWVEYSYNGKTYYFNYIMGLSTETHAMNEAGIDISVVLLLPYNAKYANMIYSGARGKTDKTYYAWNLDDPDTRELFEAILNFLGETYSREAEGWNQCYVKNWIVGNEVNMPNHWNYTGTTDLDKNVELCARQFKFVNDIMKKYNKNMKTYISIEHSWTHNDEGRGIAGKTFLDAFNKKINEMENGIDWNIAYHAYPAIMTNSDIWSSNGYTTDSVNTDFISAKNLNVLTDYVKQNFGEDVRIILSEQGFTASNGQEEKQAAALAYTYYKAEFNDMIDAVIFRSLHDNAAEAAQGFRFGLLKDDGSKRVSYDVFKYMDTDKWQEYTARCVSTMGKGSWNEVIPGFNPEKFLEEPVDEVTYQINQFVKRLYQNVLNRVPAKEEVNGWTETLKNHEDTGANAGYGFVFSEECVGRNLSNEAFVDILYRTFLNREPDSDGRDAWVEQLNCGVDREKVFSGFALSNEFKGICESYGIDVGDFSENPTMLAVMDLYRNQNEGVTMFVARCYTKALNRDFDTDGLESWCREILTGGNTPIGVAQGFIFSPEFEEKKLSDEEYAKVLYRTFLGREADEEGLAGWVESLKTEGRDVVLDGFAYSAEFTEILESFGLN